MLGHVLDTAAAAGMRSHLVLGHGAEAVGAYLQTRTEVPPIVLQGEQLGTGHAVAQAMPGVPDDATVLVLYGDVPLVPADLLGQLADRASNALALVTAQLADPSGYGRIVRDGAGRITGIVEESEASAEQRAITEVNTGLLAAPAALLRGWLSRIGNANAKSEYYLTDVVALAVADGLRVHAVRAPRPELLEGVNDRVQLARAERLYQQNCAHALLRAGVQIADPARLDQRGEVTAGRDVFIDVGVVLEGRVHLADGVRVGAYSLLRDVSLGARTQVLSHCVLENLRAGTDCRIGPFARVRLDTHFDDGVHIGNFVEIKKSRVGRGTKAGHLAYVGDATLGADVNISAGVITCNYDGANKHETVIGDGAFIGSDSQLVAPLNIGERAFIAAGSTITQDVPADGLTICRAREQKTFAKWKRPGKKKP